MVEEEGGGGGWRDPRDSRRKVEANAYYNIGSMGYPRVVVCHSTTLSLLLAIPTFASMQKMRRMGDKDEEGYRGDGGGQGKGEGMEERERELRRPLSRGTKATKEDV